MAVWGFEQWSVLTPKSGALTTPPAWLSMIWLYDVIAYLSRNYARSARSASQDKGKFTDLSQACRYNPFDVLTALWKNHRKDKHCQEKLRENVFNNAVEKTGKFMLLKIK